MGVNSPLLAITPHKGSQTHQICSTLKIGGPKNDGSKNWMVQKIDASKIDASKFHASKIDASKN